MLATLTIFSYALIFALLAALAWRDLREYILPDVLNAALALCFMAFHISLGWQLITPAEALGGALTGGLLLLAIRALANRIYQEDALGLGDIKLMAAAGLGLGYPAVFMALSLGAFLGMLHGLVLGLLEKRKGDSHKKIKWGKVNVPAGVGLAVGIALVMVWQFGFGWLNLLPK